ncbi:branched-chain-amino-acid aminotransferase [Cyclospora cayetanensis]|uniref:Branched-chain-amino-acid aminotransferase n=1 Tax=Cyclospora cayetanensis TaxID=88456 RepID=A0A1D3CUP7_9EIME|nr:branched-chain-amino-acid aminotransferase [Cyclospora cayetanensis]
MSLFVLWVNERGEEELATPALGRDLVLPGITRQTVLDVATAIRPQIKGTPRRKGASRRFLPCGVASAVWHASSYAVAERDVRMKKDLIPAFKEGRVREIFCTGTGALVVPVEGLHFQGTFYGGSEGIEAAEKKAHPQLHAASFAEAVKEHILDIQTGELPRHPFVVEC